MYLIIRKYKLQLGASIDEVMQRVTEGFLPIVSQAPGFMAYYAVSLGSKSVVSVSIFDDQTQAEEASRMAAEWVSKHLTSLVQLPPEVMAGEASVYQIG